MAGQATVRVVKYLFKTCIIGKKPNIFLSGPSEFDSFFMLDIDHLTIYTCLFLV